MAEEFEAETGMSENSIEAQVIVQDAPGDPQSDQAQPIPDPPQPDAFQADAETAAAPSQTLEGPSLASVIDVPLRITVEIGSAKMLVREVLQLNKGSVLPLDRMSGDPADIFANGRLIARGEITVLEDSLAVRIVELVTQGESDRTR